MLRVAGTVGEHHPVVIEGGEIIVPRHADHRGAARKQAADDVVLAAAVDQHDLHRAVAVGFDLRRTHFGGEVAQVRIVECGRFRASFDDDLAQHDSPFADDLRELARVDPPDGGNAVFAQPFSEAFARIPVAVFERVVRNDQPLNMNTV